MTLRWRVLVAIAKGDVSADIWRSAAEEEAAPGPPRPAAGPGCPLATGGAWRENAERQLQSLDGVVGPILRRWSCHVTHLGGRRHRPCAGMQQVLDGVER